MAETLQAFLTVLLFFLILGHFAPRGSTPRFLPSSPLSLPQSHFLIYFLWLFPSLDRAPLSISIIFQNSHWQQTLPFQPSGLEAAPLLHPTITAARQGRWTFSHWLPSTDVSNPLLLHSRAKPLLTWFPQHSHILITATALLLHSSATSKSRPLIQKAFCLLFTYFLSLYTMSSRSSYLMSVWTASLYWL